jgi:hypothetical protein
MGGMSAPMLLCIYVCRLAIFALWATTLPPIYSALHTSLSFFQLLYPGSHGKTEIFGPDFVKIPHHHCAHIYCTENFSGVWKKPKNSVWVSFLDFWGKKFRSGKIFWHRICMFEKKKSSPELGVFSFLWDPGGYANFKQILAIFLSTNLCLSYLCNLYKHKTLLLVQKRDGFKGPMAQLNQQAKERTYSYSCKNTNKLKDLLP